MSGCKNFWNGFCPMIAFFLVWMRAGAVCNEFRQALGGFVEEV